MSATKKNLTNDQVRASEGTADLDEFMGYANGKIVELTDEQLDGVSGGELEQNAGVGPFEKTRSHL